VYLFHALSYHPFVSTYECSWLSLDSHYLFFLWYKRKSSLICTFKGKVHWQSQRKQKEEEQICSLYCFPGREGVNIRKGQGWSKFA